MNKKPYSEWTDSEREVHEARLGYCVENGLVEVSYDASGKRVVKFSKKGGDIVLAKMIRHLIERGSK